MCFKYSTYLTIYNSLDKSFINFHQKNLQFNVQINLYCLCLYFGQKMALYWKPCSFWFNISKTQSIITETMVLCFTYIHKKTIVLIKC